MRSVSFLIATVGVGLVLVAASSVQASPISQPYSQNFDSIAVGGSLPNESTGSVGSPTSTWAVVADGTGNHWYQNVLSSSASVKALDSLQVSNLGTAAPADNFDVRTIIQGVSFTNPGAINYTGGLRLLASSSSSVNSSYVVDLNFGANAGRIRLVTWDGSGNATVLPSSTQSSQPLVPNFNVNDSYELDVLGTYNGSGALTLSCTATQVGAPANTVNYTYTDTAPHTGQYFGFYDSMSAGATSMTANFDNLSVTPEPATMSLLVLGGLAILRRKHAA